MGECHRPRGLCPLCRVGERACIQAGHHCAHASLSTLPFPPPLPTSSLAQCAEWDRTLSEDPSTNRMAESLDLYASTLSELATLGIPVSLMLTSEDELRAQLLTDPYKCVESLCTILGVAIGEEEGGDGPLPDNLNTMSEGELHRRVVGAITRKYQALGRCDAAYVLNATSADAVCVCAHRALPLGFSDSPHSRSCVRAQVVTSALDATVMLTLTSFGRSGRRQAYFDSMAAAAGQSRGSDSFVSHNAQY